MSIRTVKRFILLGDAGAGKSTFINFLYNFCCGSTDSDEIFCEKPHVRLAIPCANWSDYLDDKYKGLNTERDIYDQTQSQTQFCTAYSLQSTEINLELIDTPGFNDTSGVQADEYNLDQIEKTLKCVGYLNGIILVVNGSVPRIGVSFHNFLHLLQQIWPNDLLNNCITILTNCDEISVSFETSVLRQVFNVQDNCIFTFQNNLLKWDRSMKSSKTVSRYKQNFKDNIQKVDILFEKLLTFKEVSTQSFNISAIKIGAIEKAIIQSVRNMIQLVKCYKEQNIVHDAIEGARMTMNDNQNWEKKQKINAIFYEDIIAHQTPSSSSSSHSTTNSGNPYSSRISSVSYRDIPNYGISNTHSTVPNQHNTNSNHGGNRNSYGKNNVSNSYSPPDVYHSPSSSGIKNNIDNTLNVSTYQSKEPVYRSKHDMIELNLPDNEAKMRYTEAQRQAKMLKTRTQELEVKQQELSMEIRSQLDNLHQKVKELWSINRNYDVLERQKGLLQEFAEIIKLTGDHSELERYYHETVQVLTKPSGRSQPLCDKRKS